MSFGGSFDGSFGGSFGGSFVKYKIFGPHFVTKT